MKIELKSMTLQNFKKERFKSLEFAHNVVISGGNEAGKSTIYDAYLWCLFGITSRPDSTVQTLDKYNNVIHKLETSVCLVLRYNDEYDIKVERRLSERWKSKDTAEEKLLGTTQTRLIDDVPYSVSAFKEKINSLCNYDDWFMLSNINLFWSYKIDVRRKILMSLGGEINEEELMQNYPAVYQGVLVERKDIAEMLIQQKTTRKKANEELQTIPAKVQAQDALKVNDDFKALEAEQKRIESQISDIEASLQGVIVDTTEQKEYNQKLAKEKERYNNTREQWDKAHFDALNNIRKEINNIEEDLHKRTRQCEDDANENTANKRKLASLTDEFNVLMQQWKDVNEKEFCFTKTDVCPVCGRPYTDEMKEKEYKNAVNEYNVHKAEKLAEIQRVAGEKRNQIVVLKGIVNTYEQVTAKSEKIQLNEIQEKYEALSKTRSELLSRTWDESTEKANADALMANIMKSKPSVVIDATVEEKKQQKAELLSQRDEIIKRISQRDINERIEKEKEKLDMRSRELAQIVANCNEVINQIKEYKKAKINIVENNVNSLFTLIRWKFYEQNITNDDEKEICTAIDKNGIDYNNTNDGTVINMGIDIINGISKAKDIYVPLFVDRKESLENALASKQQTIYLQCKYNQPFNVETI